MKEIIPRPASAEWRDGAFVLSPDAAIGFEGPSPARAIAELLAEYLRPATGFALPVREGAGAITLAQAAPDPEPDEAGFLPESYVLDVAPGGVRLEAATSWGLARGVQTLRQLLPAEIYASETRPGIAWEAPAVRIEDKPECRWRGLMLDVSRHFFPADDVCRFVEILAQHRMNVFHWHLTDDQGWRVEIRRYPRLTEVGSKRAETMVGNHMNDWPHRFDGIPSGGFYTQDDIRRVVAFAARRRVTVVPEIDMPGHMCAAIASYPELGNGEWAHPEVRTTWGISQHVLNMEESTLAFCKDVWSEMMELFPSKFLHIGGDEAPRHRAAAGVVHKAARRVLPLARAAAARLGRDPRGRRGPLGRDRLLARRLEGLGLRERRRPRRPRRRPRADLARLLRLLPGRTRRGGAARHRRDAPALEGLLVQPAPHGGSARGREARPRRAGPALD